MRINNTYYIYNRREDQAIVTNLASNDGSQERTYTKGDMTYITMKKIMEICRKRTLTISQKNDGLTRALEIAGFSNSQIATRLFPVADVTNDSENTEKVFDRVLALDAIDKLIKFFSEFNFKPSYRFINSFAISNNPKEYVYNYFMVQDHPYAKDVAEKIKSKEFSNIVVQFKRSGSNPKPINTRFELFYGDPGTGKTTAAMKITDKCIICASDMLPADLMRNFDFDDGKAGFNKSDLWTAMENGDAIVFDEVNMLPFESLRFLQGITDGKETFNWNGYNIKIHPNFKIYATMNLNVNGQCIPLPEPLVDRSYAIKEFTLSAKDLIKAMM